MTIKTKEKMESLKRLFDKPDVDKELYKLIRATYFDRTETALELIENDPEQINRRDPYSGLTALHIAVFRQNEDIVRAIIDHPDHDISIKDKFGRRACEMLMYNRNSEIFTMVFNDTNPEYKDWDAIFAEEDLQAEIEAREINTAMDRGVTQLKPK